MSKVYVKTQAIAACEPFVYDMNALKEAYNQEFAAQGVDAYVDDCRQITGTFSNHLVVDVAVAAEGPIPVAVASLIIFIIKATAIAVAAVVILTAAASLVETIKGPPAPEVKFYTPDGQVFDTLIEYTTYMTNVYNPGQGLPYTCPYCGQGFATEEERDAHQEECPWKEGPPYPPAPEVPAWIPWVVAGIFLVVVGLGAVAVLPRLLPKE